MSGIPSIRLAPVRIAEAMSYDDAEVTFRAEFAAAKVALAESLAIPGHFNLRKMFDGSQINHRDLLREYVGSAQAIVSALDACIDVTERAQREAQP
jgi:hypothetical protein